MISYRKNLGEGFEFQIVSGDDIQDTYAKSNNYAQSCMTSKEGIKSAAFYSYVNNLYCGRFIYEGKTVFARSLIWLAHQVKFQPNIEVNWKKPDVILRDIIYCPEDYCTHYSHDVVKSKKCLTCKLYTALGAEKDWIAIPELLNSCIKYVMEKRYPTLEYIEHNYEDDFDEFLAVKVKKHPNIRNYPYVDCFRLLSICKSYMTTQHSIILNTVGGRGCLVGVDDY